MKKTFNINLAGIPFIINDDAYNLLNDYLDTIRFAFKSKDDTEELADDIETRIAEILYEADPDNKKIITLDDVSSVINRIGQPEEIIEIDDSISANQNECSEKIKIEENLTPPPVDPYLRSQQPFYKKKLYRDPQNAMLGGVCSGLAHYLNIDPTLMRLLTVVLFFLSASVVAIAYIILWIVVPEARTPYQRMQMMGKDPTVENIGKTLTENFQEDDQPNFSIKNKTGFNGFLSTVFSIFAKCIVVLCFLIGIPILFILMIVLLACIVAFFAAGGAILDGGILGNSAEWFAPGESLVALFILLAALGAIITIGIPLYLLIRKAFRKRSSNLSSGNRRSLLVFWIIGLALTAVFTVKTVKKVKYLQSYDSRFRIENLETLNELNNNDIENIHLDKEGIIITTKDSVRYKVKNGNVSIEKMQQEYSINSGVYNDSLTIDAEVIKEEISDSVK